MKPAISVLVSVCNDAEDLEKLHAAFVRAFDALDEPYEMLYLIGDAPPHRAEQAMKLREAEPDRVHVLRFSETVGRAGMLASGIEHARGELLFTLSARFEVDLAVIADLHAAVRSGTDLAFASRARGRAGSAARIQSELFNKLVSLASGRHFADVASETRALRREVADETPLYGDFYRYLPLLAERLGFRVLEIPASPHPDLQSKRVHAPRIYFWRAIDVLSIFFISRFTRHPLRLFGGVGAAFGALGLLILLVVAVQRYTGTPLADRPVLVLATLLVGLGVQTFTIGLLGELILFFQGRAIRDYRVSAVYEGRAALPAEPGQLGPTPPEAPPTA